MNDEIKVIERILTTSKKYITYAERCYVLDYITNLQTIEQKYSAILSENAKLLQKNEKLKAYIKYLEEYNPNYYKGEKFYGIDYKSRCEKAKEYIEEKISSTQGVINDYMYHKEHNKILIELLQEDIEMYKNELHILNGSDE